MNEPARTDHVEERDRAAGAHAHDDTSSGHDDGSAGPDDGSAGPDERRRRATSQVLPPAVDLPPALALPFLSNGDLEIVGRLVAGVEHHPARHDHGRCSRPRRRHGGSRLQAHPRRAAALGLPGGDARPSRGGGPRRLRCDRLADRAADRLPQRGPARSRDAPAMGRNPRRRGHPGPPPVGRPPPATDRPVRRGRQQRRPQGRPPAGPARRPDPGGRPWRHVQRRPEAAHGPLELARRPIAPREIRILAELRPKLADGGTLAASLEEHLDRAEIEEARARLDGLLGLRTFPHPLPDWPAVPWPWY